MKRQAFASVIWAILLESGSGSGRKIKTGDYVEPVFKYGDAIDL